MVICSVFSTAAVVAVSCDRVLRLSVTGISISTGIIILKNGSMAATTVLQSNITRLVA